MDNKKNILINKIDVAYRDIENLEYQYTVMKSILNCFKDDTLKKILKVTKQAKKLEMLEEKNNVAMGQQK